MTEHITEAKADTILSAAGNDLQAMNDDGIRAPYLTDQISLLETAAYKARQAGQPDKVELDADTAALVADYEGVLL